MFFGIKKINESDKKSLIQALDSIESFIKNEKNTPKTKESFIDKDLEIIFEKISNISNLLEEKSENEFGIYGEVALQLEKISDGFFDDRVLIASKNIHLQYVLNRYNEMVSNLQNDSKKIELLLNEFSNKNYLNTLDESAYRGKDFLNLVKALNLLQKELNKNSKEILEQAIQLKSFYKDSKHEKLPLISNELLNISNEISTHAKKSALSSQNYISYLGSLKEESNSSEHLEISNRLIKDIKDSLADDEKIIETIFEEIDKIEQISFETNILSFNASIEASNISHDNKRFSIVAQEVRELASKNIEAAKSIKESLKKLTKNSDELKSITESMINENTQLFNKSQNIKKLIQECLHLNENEKNNIAELEWNTKLLQEKSDELASCAKNSSEVLSKSQNIIKELITENKSAHFIGKSELLDTMDE